jgi:hypothetical protein
MFDWGLFESGSLPWMAASPDALAVITVGDSHHAARVEVKTCVLLERIAAALRIAAMCNQETIVCCISDETWTECVKENHATQVQTQLSVL